MKKMSEKFQISEDGHPCEAALEFRRLAIRNSIVTEIDANALDLAISFAWIGKAISRTNKLHAWSHSGVDPNTWQIVRAMALDLEIRRNALHDALKAPSSPEFNISLNELRNSHAFNVACQAIRKTFDFNDKLSDNLFWLSELAYISIELEGPKSLPALTRKNNVVFMSAYSEKQ